jgi:hypothetical protein
VKYDRPVRELLAECVATLAEPFERGDVLGWFHRHYPDIADGTVAAHIQALTDGTDRGRHHPGVAHYPPLLQRVGRGLYRRANAGGSRQAPQRDDSGVAAQAAVASAEPVDVVLVGCVKSKGPRPAPAQELYRGSLFKRRIEYARASGCRWFVVSGRWGLVAPDEVLAPYDLYLADQSAAYRRGWAGFVAATLERVNGSLIGARIEIHAGDSYVSALRPALNALGAVVVDPVQAGSFGETLSWYDRQQPASARPTGPADSGTTSSSPAGQQASAPDLDRLADQFAAQLSDPAVAMSVPQLLARGSGGLNTSGLYSWWVDDAGSDDLSLGLAVTVHTGLIYLG